MIYFPTKVRKKIIIIILGLIACLGGWGGREYHLYLQNIHRVEGELNWASTVYSERQLLAHRTDPWGLPYRRIDLKDGSTDYIIFQSAGTNRAFEDRLPKKTEEFFNSTFNDDVILFFQRKGGWVNFTDSNHLYW